MFQGMSDTLADTIGPDPANNTVGYVGPQIYQDNTGNSIDDTGSDTGLIHSLAKAAKSGLNNSSAADSFYRSPAYMAQRYTELGKFFGGLGTSSGAEYTSRIKQPSHNKPAQAENPSDFYARWYNKMRQFAESSEVANRGQTTVRTR